MRSRCSLPLLSIAGLLGALGLTLAGHTPARAAAVLNVPGTFSTIQAAIDVAANGDTVLVADGAYTGEGNKNLDFGGKLITVRSQNGPAVTVIDCAGGDFFGRGFYFHSGETAAARVEGFTIRNGFHTAGAGMLIENSSPTVTHCAFINNHCTAVGGGMAIYNSSAAVTSCLFNGNIGSVSAGAGAGMYLQGGSPVVTNCTFSGNLAFGVIRIGGGMAIESGSAAVTNCTFSGNEAPFGEGGGMHIGGGTPAVTNCILWGNSPDQIFVAGGAPTVSYSDVQQAMGPFPGTGNINADPQFVRDPSPGSDGFWSTPDDDYGDLRLQPASPCVDAGNNDAVSADTPDLDGDLDTAEPLPFDRDGQPRFSDMPGVPGTGNGAPPLVDMGAFELFVSDTTPPAVECRVGLPVLAPPNHSLVNVGLSVSAADETDPAPVIRVQVYSDEDDAEATGDGTYSPDARQLAPSTLRLRAERSEGGNGRVYLIVVTATDAAGNVGFHCCTMVVPHNRSSKAFQAVAAQAAAAEAYCAQHGGAAPAGYFVVGDGPVVGSKQ
jgi:parallel beta helix pectate lyase-like protein